MTTALQPPTYLCHGDESLLCSRDIIEVRLSVGGVCCMITDTAGIRTNIEAVASGQIGGLNAVEEEGIRRAR